MAPDVQRDALLEEQARLTTEITNITKAIATGLDISALAEALKERDSRLRAINAQLAKPLVVPDREVLRAALELRTVQWRDVLRGPHIAQARLVLQHLIDLPIRIHNEPSPAYIKKGSSRGVEGDRRYANGKWVAAARPEGLLVGLVQNLASPTRHGILYLEGPLVS